MKGALCFLYLLRQFSLRLQILSPEVIAMNADGIWRSFVDTGDPVCYLLAKRLEQPPVGIGAETQQPRRNDSHIRRPGDRPRPSN